MSRALWSSLRCTRERKQTLQGALGGGRGHASLLSLQVFPMWAVCHEASLEGEPVRTAVSPV